ncbi:MAG: hypothetical protein GY810_09580 [Aureispira sp.]|nr:hypothetical protein [Aureispira sp.]
MKTISKLAFAFIFIMTGYMYSAAQDCGNKSFNPVQSPTIRSIGQSFEICSNVPGKITEISIHRSAKLNAKRSGMLKLFKGETKTGTPIHTQAVVLEELPKGEERHEVSIVLSKGVDYLPGQKYTFFIELDGTILPSANYANPYAKGRGFAHFDTNPSWDFYFNVGFEPDFCGNKAINGGTKNPTVKAIGQSFKVCSDKPGMVTAVTFQRCAWIRNEKRTGTLKMFEGDTKTGTPIHTQSVTLDALPLEQKRVDVTVELSNGMAYTPGKQYTFFIELDQLIVVGAHYSNPYADGKGYIEKDVNPSWDMYFNILYTELATTNTLEMPNALAVNDKLVSTNGKYTLLMQTDCNLVIYEGAGYSKPIWATNTDNGRVDAKKAQVIMQADGHFVLYNEASTPTWASGTHASVDSKFNQTDWKPVKAVLKDDGALVLISATGKEVWSSK